MAHATPTPLSQLICIRTLDPHCVMRDYIIDDTSSEAPEEIQLDLASMLRTSDRLTASGANPTHEDSILTILKDALTERVYLRADIPTALVTRVVHSFLQDNPRFFEDTRDDEGIIHSRYFENHSDVTKPTWKFSRISHMAIDGAFVLSFLKGRSGTCDICGEVASGEFFPFEYCRFCHQSPSHHHGRCCPDNDHPSRHRRQRP